MICHQVSIFASALNTIEKSSIDLNKAIKLLFDLDLIVEWPIKIKFTDSEKNLEGMFKIDHKKLEKLDPDDIVKLHKNRCFEIIY